MINNELNIDISKVKMILRFEFIEDNKVKLHIVSIKKDVLYDAKHNNGYNFYSDDINKFSIWSSGEFALDRTQLKLPELKHSRGEVNSTCKFQDDESRKTILKKLYKSLTKWSNYISDDNIENCVVVDKEYWYVQ